MNLQKEKENAEEEKKLKNYLGCKIWEEDVCKECAKGYYFNDEGICCEINPQCRIFNVNMGKCEGCYDGY